MTNHQDLDKTFQALADPTRRRVFERLGLGPATVTELAAPFDMALPSFMQHLKVLERSHLVRSEKIGRVRTFRLVPQQIENAERWLKAQHDGWGKSPNQLDSYVQELAEEENRD